MSTIPAALRRSVIQRASNRCGYCRLSQAGQEATFHIDHIVPVLADGKTTADNLALACVSCSLHKAARQMAKDTVTGESAHLLTHVNKSGKSIFNGITFGLSD